MRQFRSLEALGAHLARVADAVPATGRRILDKAGKRVRLRIREQLGDYPSGGAMGRWPQLAESTQERRSRLGFRPNDPLLMTGALRDSVRVTAGPGEVTVGTPIEHAKFHEFGTAKEPPRPVFGPAMRADKRENEKATAAEMARAFRRAR